MNKTNMLILILVMLSTTTLTGYALAEDKDMNIPTNETTADKVSTAADTIAINENVNAINITKNSNETTVAEMILKGEQKKSSPGFSLTDLVMSLISAVILIGYTKWGYINGK